MSNEILDMTSYFYKTNLIPSLVELCFGKRPDELKITSSAITVNTQTTVNSMHLNCLGRGAKDGLSRGGCLN